MFAFDLNRFAGFFAVITLLAACGPGSEGNSTGASQFEGVLIGLDAAPISDIPVTLFETGESSITDETGFFSLDSARTLSSAGFFFEIAGFTNVARVEPIPDGSDPVRITFVFDLISNTVGIAEIEFNATSPEPSVTPTPMNPGEPGESPTATATPTPPPGKFDSNGNTTAFGIPPGLTGNISEGKVVWQNVCSECHLESQKLNRSYGQIKAATLSQPAMNALGLTNAQIADVTAYLNRNRR